MTNILFATDRQAEHLARARELCGVRAFHADAIAIAVYEDEGSKRDLTAIAVFHGQRGDRWCMTLAIPDGSALSLESAKGLAAAAFFPKYLGASQLEAWVDHQDRETQITLLRAGFVFEAILHPFIGSDPRTDVVLSLGRDTFHAMEAANAAD